MHQESLEVRQADMRKRMTEQRFCPSCGSGLEGATVSVANILSYLQRDSYLPIAKAAEYLGVSQRFLARRKFEIPHYRPGGRVLFKRSEVEQWIEGYRREPAKLDLKRLLDEVVVKVRAKKVKQATRSKPTPE